MWQSALHAAGIQAERVETWWWVIFWVTTVVTVIVFAFLTVAVRRGRAAASRHIEDRSLLRHVGIATALTVVILIGLLTGSILTSRALASENRDDALEVTVTAYQWWWSVDYQHPEPQQRFRTANEMHIPVGRDVKIKLLGADVIHSFWVPSLAGTLDAIPGHESTLWIKATEPGVYRGQCAEYCGFQHAHMGFVVVAEPSDDFERWVQAQRQTAHQPQSPLEQRGLQLVQTSACVMCHSIRGTAAAARIAPDLTHFATRATIAAGTRERTTEYLQQWLKDPQSLKPGTRMPTLGLSDEDRAALVAYLEQLR
jgi:cytochrome c oxidase subunit 2